MKQEVYKPVNLFLSKFLSDFIKFFWKIFVWRKFNLPTNLDCISSIVVLEYHCIGDVILVAPALNIIRNNFPKASITLVTNQPVHELAQAAAIADKVVSISIPWIHNIGSPQKWISFCKQIISLRKSNFNLGFNFKGDFRDLGLLRWINPDIRVGFNATGGDFFLTHVYPFPFEKHQVDRAIHLLYLFGLLTDNHSPTLSLPIAVNYQQDHKTHIIIHGGAAHPFRMWPDNHWLTLIELLQPHACVTVVDVSETLELCNLVKEQSPNTKVFKGSLLDFSQQLKIQSLLIGLDSMAVHLAIAVGIPAIALFGSQNPELTKPYGSNGYVITPPSICKHKKTNWRLCKDCMSEIDPHTVYDTATKICSL